MPSIHPQRAKMEREVAAFEAMHPTLVDRYKRDDGNGWTFHRYEVLTDEVEFPSIGATLLLTDIYEDIEFVDEAI